MDNRRQVYLKEMGIDVWTLRTERVKAVPEDAPVGKPDVVRSTPVSSQMQSGDNTGNTSLADLRKQMAAAAAPINNQDDKSVKAANKQKELAKRGTTTVNDGFKFLFCFLDYEHISLLIALPDNADGVPTEYRQLCDDIVFALSRQRKIPNVRALRWPMLDASHIQQSVDEARLVMKEMFKHSRSNLVLFGDATAKYQHEIEQGTYMTVADLEHYLKVPADKALLWQKLKPLIKTRTQAS